LGAPVLPTDWSSGIRPNTSPSTTSSWPSSSRRGLRRRASRWSTPSSRPGDLITKLMTAVESGHVPDIATVEVGMVAQLAGMGATTITADLLAAIEAQTGDRFSEAAVRLVSIDGQPRGVPTATFPAALFYRNDLLEAAGVEPPQTIAAFREVARRTNNPRAGIYGAGIPLGRSGGNDIEGFIRH